MRRSGAELPRPSGADHWRTEAVLSPLRGAGGEIGATRFSQAVASVEGKADSTIARIPRRMASGSRGHASTRRTSSGSGIPSTAIESQFCSRYS